MYRYDQYDHAMVQARVAEFRDQTRRRIAGQLNDDQFKPLRLKNGLYLQLHAYMLRVAIPYGTLNSRQMRKLAHIARTYDRGYGHFTTRQNIQYNWIKLEEAPDILAELAEVEMHAIQTSGESIRNISADQYACAAADEIMDPRPWAETIRQMTTFMPEFSYLPRKFKIAVIATEADRAALRWHDFAVRIVKNEAGEIGFETYAGGGMGRTPFIAYKIRDFLPTGQILSYLQAVLRVWNRNARRDNIHKQRMKILVHELGEEEFRRQVEEEFAHFLTLGHDFPHAEYDRIAAYFAPPAWETGLSEEIDPLRSRLRAVGRPPGRRAQGAGLRDRQHLAQADRPDPRRHQRRADGARGRPRRALQLRRAALDPRPEPRPAARPQAGPPCGVDRARRGGAR